MTLALRSNSSIAAVAFKWESEIHIRVYFQDTKGYVRESRSKNGEWSGGAEADRLFQAKPNTPLAAITWNSEPPSIRVYYVNMENILQEHCWNGQNWFGGGLNSRQIQVDYRSKIAATWGCWSGTREPQIRVLYQSPHKTSIQMVPYDGSYWRTSITVDVPAVLGTGFAALVMTEGRYTSIYSNLNLYYQESDCTVKAYSFENNRWKSQTLGKAIYGTAITAITWSDGPQARVYYEHANGEIVESEYGIHQVREKCSWSEPRRLADSLLGTSIAACSVVSGSSVQTRLYFQKDSGKLQEYCGGGWVPGDTVVPT